MGRADALHPGCRRPRCHAGWRSWSKAGRPICSLLSKGRSRPGARMQKGQDFHTRHKRTPREKTERIRLGSLEFKKKGISRFDMRDPYHLAVALTWPQFIATLLAM